MSSSDARMSDDMKTRWHYTILWGKKKTVYKNKIQLQCYLGTSRHVTQIIVTKECVDRCLLRIAQDLRNPITESKQLDNA